MITFIESIEKNNMTVTRRVQVKRLQGEYAVFYG